jgi:hypothetical protein
LVRSKDDEITNQQDDEVCPDLCGLRGLLRRDRVRGHRHILENGHLCRLWGAKTAIASEVGVMEAPADFETFQGIGGPFCVLDSTPRVSIPMPEIKAFKIHNAVIWANPGDEGGIPDETWVCVVCQYEDKVVLVKSQSIPTVSALGTAILLGGLMTAAIYRIRRKQGEATA